MLPLVGAAVGLIGAAGKMIGRGKANKEMNSLLAQDPKYVANPIARQRMGLAQTLLNARMPGSAALERNIYSNRANTISNLERNATDASQLLAGGAKVQGQTDDAFQDLQFNEAQDYQRRYGNLENAQEGVIREDDKVFNDGVRRFQNKVQIKGAINENRQNSWGDVSNLGFGLMNIGMSGGLSGMGGGGGTGAAAGGMSQATRDMLKYGVSNPLYGG